MTVKSAVIYILPPFFKRYVARIEASPLGYRLARGTFWSLSGALISRGLALLASVLVARILGKSGFGELGIIQSTVGMFGVFAGFGMGVTATKHVAEFRDKDPEKAGRIMALSGLVAIVSGGIMALALFIFAPWLAANTLAAPHLNGLLKISAGLLFLTALNGAQTGALAGFEAFRTIAKVNLIAGIVAFPCMVGGVYLGGLEGAVWGLVASTAWNWFLNHLALRKEARRTGIPFSFQGCLEEGDVLWRFSLPAVLASSMVGPVNWVCSAILVNQPDGYAEMGIFNAANQWRMIILYLPGIISQIILPILSDLHATDQAINYNKILRINILLNFILTLIIALPAMLLSPSIMASYGEGFNEGNIVLILLAASAVISATLSVIGQSIASMGKMWIGFVLNLIWSILIIGITWCLRASGAKGLALATLLAYSVHLVTVSIYTWRMIHNIPCLKVRAS